MRCQEKETLKKKCFSRRGNVSTVWQSTTSLSMPFQSVEPAARNVRSPIVVCRTLGNCSRCVRADRSQCLLGMLAIRRWGRRPSTAESIHAAIWRSTSPAWIVCAQTRKASGGWWASDWCGLSAGDQRQIGQRRWAQIGDDDTGKPDSN